MCDPCRLLRRCISCHGGCCCCPRPNCCVRSCSIDSRNCRVVFPGEFQKFSDMVPPSFLQKQKTPSKKKKRSKSCTACEDVCDDPCADKCTENCEHPRQTFQKRKNLDVEQNAERLGQDDGSGYGAIGPGFNGVPGAGFGFQPGQPTIIPCYGTYGPDGNPLIFGVPPPTQYGNFGIPGPFVLPVAQPSAVGQGDARNPRGPPAAGLPSKYLSRFNPCTGEIINCENQQNSAGKPVETRQGPSYNQFCQGLGTGFGPNSQYYPFNVGGQPIDPRQVVPNNSPASPQGGNRSKSMGPTAFYNQQSQPLNFPPNNQNYPYNVEEGTLDSRQVPQSLSSAVQERQGANSSKSRISRSDKPPELRKAPVNYQQSKAVEIGPNNQYYPNNVVERNLDPRALPKTKPSTSQEREGNNRKRNQSMGAPLNNHWQPESNMPYNQQSVGMGFDPSNQYYPYNVADCPLNATFVLDSSNAQPRQNNERSHSARPRNVSKERPEKSKNSKGLSSLKQSGKSLNDQPVKCYCTRFDPNNQYYPYYVTEEGDCPPSEKAKGPKECSELLNRVTDSCPPCDLQKWCHLLMPKGKRKTQVKPAAKKKNKKADTRLSLKSKSKMSVKSTNEVEASGTPKTSVTVEPASPIPEEPEPEDSGCPCGCNNLCPPSSPKPEMRSCSCSANIPAQNGANPAPCVSYPVNSGNTACCNTCPWSWYYSPCNGCYYYCANCCNGCRNCCNHCCSPCGRCCSSSCPAQMEKVPPKPKPKEKEKPDKSTASSRRNSAGMSVQFNVLNNPADSGIRRIQVTPPPVPFNCSMPSGSTIPGYGPIAPPQFNSPYSGHWEAGGVDINRANQCNNRSPLNISCMRHG
uniref:Uncharacterized protein LOC108045601 n=1 Tax=Drosophila rhopaloa TaxID=1041015 RepID=A0A6P4EZ87_DRORH